MYSRFVTKKNREETKRRGGCGGGGVPRSVTRSRTIKLLELKGGGKKKEAKGGRIKRSGAGIYIKKKSHRGST